MNDVQWVFICGCARSGTSTTADLLRSHKRFAMGRERYWGIFNTQSCLSLDLFQKERFCTALHEGDTHHKLLDRYYEELLPRFDGCTHVGDKIPLLHNSYDKLNHNFPGCKFVFLVRNIFDVAQSFEVRRERSKNTPDNEWPPSKGYKWAVNDWNTALCNTLNAFDKYEILVVEYEQLYTSEEHLRSLFSFLNADFTETVYDFWVKAAEVRANLEAKRAIILSSLQKNYIMKHADFQKYQNLVSTPQI